METKGPQVFIRLDGAFDELQKIRDTPIVAQGHTLKLSDIATVERGYEDPSTFLIRNAGEPALLLGIVMREGWNGLVLGKALDNEVGAINAEQPLGMSLTKVTDQAVNISSAVDEFMVKFFAALLVVMLVSFLSMGWRVGLVVAAAVPLTLAAVFVVMLATGKNFDRITLGSLILALGLLVDDAIIAIEMMVVKMAEGHNRVAASAYAWATPRSRCFGHAGHGSRLHAGRLRAIDRGRVHQQHVLDRKHRTRPSWVVAVIFTPYLGVKLLPDVKKIAGGHDAIYDTPRYRRFRHFLQGVIARNGLSQVRWSVCSFWRILGMAVVKKQFFPISDRPEVLIEVQMPYGTSITQTSAATEKVEPGSPNNAKPRSSPLTSVRARRASTSRWDRTARSVVCQDRGAHRQPGRTQTLKYGCARRSSMVSPRGGVRVTQLVFGPYSPFPVAYRVTGPDPDTLRKIAADVQVMDASPMMRTVNTDWAYAAHAAFHPAAGPIAGMRG